MNDDNIISFRYKFDIPEALFPVRKGPPGYVIRAAMEVNNAHVEYIILERPFEDYLQAIKEYNKALERWRKEKIE